MPTTTRKTDDPADWWFEQARWHERQEAACRVHGDHEGERYHDAGKLRALDRAHWWKRGGV